MASVSVVWLFQISEADRHDKRQRVARKGPSHKAIVMTSAGKAASRALRPSAVATATVTRVAPHDLRLFRLKRAPSRVVQRFLRLSRPDGPGNARTTHPAARPRADPADLLAIDSAAWAPPFARAGRAGRGRSPAESIHRAVSEPLPDTHFIEDACFRFAPGRTPIVGPLFRGSLGCGP